MFTWIKNNKLLTTLIAIALIYVIVSLIRKEWNPLKWFSADAANERRTNILNNPQRVNCTDADGEAYATYGKCGNYPRVYL